MRGALLLALAALLCGCPKQGGHLPEIMGEINNEYLTTAEFMHHFRARGGASLEGEARRAFKRWLMAELIDRKILLQEAARRRVEPVRKSSRQHYRELGALPDSGGAGLREVSDELHEQRKIEILLTFGIAPPPPPTEEEVREYVDAHKEDFSRPEQVRLRQIVVHSAAAMKKACELIGEGMPFAEAARLHSETPEAAQGGLMNWAREEDLPLEIWQAARMAPEGEVVGPVPSSYGLHLFVVEGRRQGGPEPDWRAQSRARKLIVRQRRQEAAAEFIAGLRSKAKIAIDMEALERL